MPIQVIKNFQELDKYESEWNRLAPSPTMTFEWMKAWWQAFGGNHELHVLIVTNDHGSVLGIAPWYIARQYCVRTLKFLGSGKVCSDYLQILAEPADQPQVQSAIFDFVEQKTRRGSPFSVFRGIEFEGICSEDSRLTGLLSRLTKANYQLQDKPIENAWQIQLPDTWEDLLASLGNSFRRKIKKCIERIDSGALQVRIAESESDWQEAYAILSQLHQARRKSIQSDGCFDDPRFCNFLNSAIPAMMKKRRARVAWLISENKPIAACLLLLGDSYVGMYQSGIDPDAMALEPGHSLGSFLIRDAIRNKSAIYDFMRGNESYKAMWRAKTIGLTKTFLVPPSLGARCALGVENLARRAYHRIKRASQPMPQPKPELEQNAQAVV
jgi:CelD/BcsL family acetyltransferase involved in cellulose biosynthesis